MENQVSVFVNFDRAKPGYSPKESVSGNVYVKANVDCVLKDLTVSFFTLDVETETREGGKDAHPAKDFPLKQGEGKAFPFLFTAPDDPYQWAASREVAQWFVEARAEVTTIVKGEEETDRFEATGSYSIMQRPSEYQQPEARQEGEVQKKAVKQEVTSPGAWVTGILFSLVFWGLVYGGLLLTMNGYSERTIPEGVRYFGLAVLLGGFFVIGKLYEGLGKGISRFTSTLVMAISLFAFYAFAVGPTFDITQFALHPEPPRSILFAPVSAAQLLFAITGFTLLIQSGLFFYAKDPKRLGLWELGGAIPAYCCAALGISSALAAGAGIAIDSGTLGVMALLGVVGLVILVITLRRPGWNNLPMGLTVLASAPLFWIGLMQMPLWVDVPADGAVFQWLLSGLMLLGGGFILVFGNRNRVASIKLGNVTASVEPLTIAQGGYVTVNVKFQPRKAVFVNGITAELLCHRSQRTGRTGSQDREHWIDYNATSMVKLDRMVQAGENIARSLEVVFPAGCHRSDSETQWELRLRIDAAKAIDWTEIYTIEVK